MAIESGVVPSIGVLQRFALSGLADFHAPKVSPLAVLADERLLVVGEVLVRLARDEPLVGREAEDSRAESAYATPASPCAAHVPAISSMPLPMMVLQTMSVGLPFFDSLAYLYALVTASMSWPSTVSTSQPCASKRICTSSDCVCSAILSRVTPFESYMRMRLSSFSWPAKATASLATPSCRQPSPQSTTTWWSMIECSGCSGRPRELGRRGHADAVAGLPSGPVVDARRRPNSGWPRRLRVLHAEVLDLLHREVIARQVQPGVQNIEPWPAERMKRSRLIQSGLSGLYGSPGRRAPRRGRRSQQEAHVARGSLGDRVDGQTARLICGLRARAAGESGSSRPGPAARRAALGTPESRHPCTLASAVGCATTASPTCMFILARDTTERREFSDAPAWKASAAPTSATTRERRAICSPCAGEAVAA